jgi:hypothetical protein
VGVNGVLLKVREGKYEREHGEAQMESRAESILPSQGAFKTYANLKEGRNQVIPIQ